MRALVLLGLLILGVVGKEVIYVDLIDLPSPTPIQGLKVSVPAVAGLENRQGPKVYLDQNSYDKMWFRELVLPTMKKKDMDPVSFLQYGLNLYPAILFDPSQQDYLPAVVTLAGTMGAIPITEDAVNQLNVSSYKIILDTRGLWSSAEQSIQYTTNCCLNQTSSLALQGGDRLINGQLVDWIVQEKLFVQYLKKQCIPFTSVKDNFNGAIKASNWPLPVRVYGYNSLDVLFGGDLFEAETDCNRHLGQVASSDTSNLGFWSKFEPFIPGTPQGEFGGPMRQLASDHTAFTYEKNKTFVALVYGDMDNLNFVQTFGSDHMKDRRRICQASPKNCFPFTWTLSPNLINVAPAILRWYYAQAVLSGNDRFIMPPSGTLYSYPGIMPPHVQDNYVEQQNEQANLMNTTGTIHWEWLFTWGQAWVTYFPRYIDSPGTRFFFLNDVPWKVPIPGMTFLYHENYRIIDDAPRNFDTSVIGFRPAFNWQYNGASGGDPGNATHIAGRINNLKIGSIQYVYIIQNTPVDMVFDMVSQLDDHVQLVNHEQLADLAIQHHRFFGESDKEGLEGEKRKEEEQEVSGNE